MLPRPPRPPAPSRTVMSDGTPEPKAPPSAGSTPLPLSAYDPEHLIAHALAQSLRRLLQAAMVDAALESPASLERAYLAAHAWSMLVRAPSHLGLAFKTPREPIVSVFLLQRLATRHAACAMEELRLQVRALATTAGTTPTAQRLLMQVHCELDTGETALRLALRLAGRSTGFRTDSLMQHRARHPTAPILPRLDQ